MSQDFCAAAGLDYGSMPDRQRPKWLQWNLSVTTTFIIKIITCDLFSNVF